MKIKTILFITFTRSHYNMAVELLKELKSLDYKIKSNIMCSGYLYDEQELIVARNEFNMYYFFNEFPLYENKLLSYKLRNLISNVGKTTKQIKPDLIFTFSDNAPLYQDMFFEMKNKTKIVLFHEGYGDYSNVYIPLKSYIGFFIQKLFIYPYKFKIITRSYTNYYTYSFLFFSNLVQRNHSFKKMGISKEFAQKVFIQIVQNDKIKEDSIFLCLSAKNWTEGKLKHYFLALLEQLNKLENYIYIKIAPHQDKNEYVNLMSSYSKINLIDDNTYTSESYCFHNNFKYIITDESSSAINALFAGIDKTIYFLNKDIENLGYYKYDYNSLMEYLVEAEIILQLSSGDMIKSIQSNTKLTRKLLHLKDINLSKQLKEVIDE